MRIQSVPTAIKGRVRSNPADGRDGPTEGSRLMAPGLHQEAGT